MHLLHGGVRRVQHSSYPGERGHDGGNEDLQPAPPVSHRPQVGPLLRARPLVQARPSLAGGPLSELAALARQLGDETADMVLQVDGNRRRVEVEGGGRGRSQPISTTISISTGMSNGSSAIPTAHRVCRPASPNTATSTSEHPSITSGVRLKPGAQLTMPKTRTT